MAPSAQSAPYQNHDGTQNSLNDSRVVAGSCLTEDFEAFFTEENLERLFNEEKLKEMFDSTIDQYAAGYFVPFLALTKSDNGLFLKYSQNQRASWQDEAIVPEALKVKIRCTVRRFIQLLFDVHHSAHPIVDENNGDSLAHEPNEETVQLGLDWKQENEIVPVLEMMSQLINKESFVEIFAEDVWLHTVLLSQGLTPLEMTRKETMEVHSMWKFEEMQERKQISIKFAERKLLHILRQSLKGGTKNVSIDYSDSSSTASLWRENESSPVSSGSGAPLLGDVVDGTEAEEVLERILIGDGVDKRCNESFHYLVKWRNGTSSWVSYRMLNNPDVVREFKRKHKLVPHSKRSPKRLSRTNRL